MEKKIIPIMLNGVQIGEIEDRTTPEPEVLPENSFKYQNIIFEERPRLPYSHMEGDIVGIEAAAKYLGISEYKVKRLIKLKLIGYRLDGVNFEIIVFWDKVLDITKRLIEKSKKSKMTFKAFCNLYAKIE